jgi:hypothetical protein
VTNADGETVIPRRPTHRRPYYRVTARGYATAWGELDRDSLLGSGFEVRLARLATVVGRLVDEAGRPVPNVQVFVVETLQSTRSGSDGRFTLHALPLDGGTITAEPRGYGIVHLDNVRPRGEPTDLGDIRLGAGLSITGRVFGVEGTPANGVYVWSRDVGTGLSARAAPTDAQGRFEIAGLADRAYALTTHARGQPPPGKTAPSAKLASVPAGAQGVVLRLLARPVLGIALVATGSTESLWVRRLEVVATRREGGARVEKEAESKQRKRRVAGTVVVLPAEGTYDVVVRAPGHGEANFEVAIGPDEMRTFSVELPRGEDG